MVSLFTVIQKKVQMHHDYMVKIISSIMINFPLVSMNAV